MTDFENNKQDNISMDLHLDLVTRMFGELRPVRVEAEDYFSDIKRALLPFIEPLGVAHMEAEYTSTGTKLVRKQYQDVVYFHSNDVDEDEEQAIRKSYADFDGGQYLLTFRPFYGRPFTDMARKQLDIFSDLLFAYTDRFRMSAIIHRIEDRDLLTGIHNLTGFYKFVNEKIRKGTIRRYNAYFLNCNNYKLINKVVQTTGGDEIMKLYAQKLAAFCDPDEIVARPGGDNYVALIHKDRHEDFLKLTEGILIKYPYKGEIKEFNIGAGVGCYDIPRDINSAGELMTPVSIAANTAKTILHRHVAYFDEDMEAVMYKQMRVQNEFYTSLKQNEFVPYIQPKVDMKTGEIVGGEVLARWIHNGEFILPADFIPSLERNGMIAALDMFMLRETCKIINKWTLLDYQSPRLSVNLSRWNLNSPHLIEDIDKILGEYKIDASLLEVELTESLEYNEYVVMEKLFNDLIDRGITTAIDDFGTGFSSINTLRRLDVNVLKIDRTFLTDLEEGVEVSQKDQKLLSMIISTAQDLGIEVLAEGVENDLQRELLLKHGCNLAQGFLFYQPMPVEDFEALFFGDK